MLHLPYVRQVGAYSKVDALPHLAFDHDELDDEVFKNKDDIEFI